MKSLSTLFTEKLRLEKSHYEKFSDKLKIKNLKKKDLLIREGTVCNFIGFTTSGTLRSYVTNDEIEFNNDFYFTGDFVTAYTSFLTEMPTNCNIEALTNCTIHYIHHENLNALIEQDIAFLKISKYISDNYFIRKCKRETSFLKCSATERLKKLDSLFPGIEGQISQYHIASYLGITPESLSRIKLLSYINK